MQQPTPTQQQEQPQVAPTTVPNATSTIVSETTAQQTSVTDPVDNTMSVNFHTLIEKLEQNQPSSKPIFSTYNPKTDFFKWKGTCLLALAANKSKHYQSFVTVDSSNNRILDENMSYEKKIQLFNMT